MRSISAREGSVVSQDTISSKTGVKQSAIPRMEQLGTNEKENDIHEDKYLMQQKLTQ